MPPALGRHPFYRRYGANLPSSLGRVHSRALEYSSRIPVSVCGTGIPNAPNEAFPGSIVSLNSPQPVALGTLRTSAWCPADLPTGRPRMLRPGLSTPGSANFLRHSEDQNEQDGTGILTSFASTTPTWPRLSSRLTLGRRALPRKPYPYGDTDFHRDYRYSSLDTHFQFVHARSRLRFCRTGTLNYHPTRGVRSAISANSLVPIIFGADSLGRSAVTHCLNDGCL